MGRTFIIAEAGDNHNGRLDLAFRLIDKAVEAGADCVKFQTFVTEELVSMKAGKAEYQKEATGSNESQYEMLKKLELSFDGFKQLQEYAEKKAILFLSTPFDCKSVSFLDSIGIPCFKIPSGEITNLPYLIQIAETGKDVILSTGMAELEEIEQAVRILQRHGAGRISLLHCNTEYPTPMEDVNLRAMLTLKEQFDLSVGYSDHTRGIEVPIAAVALGAEIIEKHFTLDRSMEGPDHAASLEPDELKQMVDGIRNIDKALGDSVKTASKSELKNRDVARKSIVAGRDIEKGECFSEKNLAVKRPGNGISPMKWFDLLGTKASRDYCKDELIENGEADMGVQV